MCRSPCRILRAVRTRAARSMRASAPAPLDHHLHIDAALRMQHRDHARARGLQRGAGHGAGQREGGGHADGASHRMAGVAAPRREVARGDAVGIVAGAGDHRLGHHAGRHITQAHGQAGLEADGLDAGQQRAVGIQVGWQLASAQAQVGGAHHHQRHGRIDAGDLDAVDHVDALPGGKHRARHRAPGIQEVQPDRRRRAGHAVDAGAALVGDAAARGQHRHVDARAGVDVEHPHRGLAVLRGHQTLLDGEWRHAREHVAAVGPGVDAALAHAHLGKQVVDVAARLGRLRDDGHLAGQRAAAAHAVDLQQVGRADGADQRLVTGRLVGRQPVAQKERPAGGAGTHQDARDHGSHGSA